MASNGNADKTERWKPRWGHCQNFVDVCRTGVRRPADGRPTAVQITPVMFYFVRDYIEHLVQEGMSHVMKRNQILAPSANIDIVRSVGRWDVLHCGVNGSIDHFQVMSIPSISSQVCIASRGSIVPRTVRSWVELWTKRTNEANEANGCTNERTNEANAANERTNEANEANEANGQPVPKNFSG